MARKKSSKNKLPPSPAGEATGSWSTSSGSGGAGSAPSGQNAAAGASTPSSSSASSSGSAKGSSAASSPARATVPTVVDMSKAREEALFQLRLGRQALAFGFLVGLLLIVDSAVALLVGTSTLAAQGNVGAFLQSLIHNYLPLALPLAAALFLNAAVFYEKYDTYAFWPFEDHFAITIAGLALSVALTAIYVEHFAGRGPDIVQYISPVIYPLVLVAISLGMISLGTTWRGRAIRKVSSIVFGFLPPLLYFPLVSSLSVIGGSGGLNLGVSIAFSFAAFLYTASGAQLHLMASATRAQEREIVAGSHEKLFQLSQELSRRSEAAAFREEALSRREVDAEAQEAALAERTRFLETRRSELERLDSHLRTRSDEVSLREQAFLPKAAEVAANEASLKERKAQLDSQEGEVQAGFERVSQRERSAMERETSLRQKELEVQSRAAEVARAEAQSKVLEQTAQQRFQEAERRFGAAVSREAEVRALQATAPPAPGGPAPSTGSRDMDLSRREATLEAQRAEVADRLATVSQKELAVERRRVELQQVASTILEREKAVATRESGLGSKEKEYESDLERLKGATKRHEDEIRKYYDSAKRSMLVESQTTLKLGQLNDREKELTLREDRLRGLETGLQTRKEELERLTQAVDGRRRQVESQAADLQVRSASLEAATARLAPSRSEVDSQMASALKDRERALEFREKQLAEREQKLRAQSYERERAAAPPGVPALEEAPAPGAPAARRVAGRASTGTPRLDDLLLGGFPERSHVAFVGPAFVGKEVAIYSFLAEGLRHGQSSLIVATQRPPAELARELGTVVPSLMEYEGAGKVVWVDASNPAGVPARDERAARGSTVKGPGDLGGILQAVVRHSSDLEKNAAGMRVAFLSLSACMTQTDDKGAAAFVQNLLGILRPRGALGAYSVDRGMHSGQQVEGIVSQMDGAVEFRSERGKTSLQVVGLGEVQSRQWVDYRFNQRSLQLGSFSLERIR